MGKTLEIPSVDGTIPVKVVGRRAVDPKFGTGVIKVTPGHDPVDFEIGAAPRPPVRATVIGFDGKMNERPASTPGSTASRRGGGSSRT